MEDGGWQGPDAETDTAPDSAGVLRVVPGTADGTYPRSGVAEKIGMGLEMI
jgi:hypothetical protein